VTRSVERAWNSVVMDVHARDGAGRWRDFGVSYLDFRDWRASTTTFSGLAAFSQTTTTLGDTGRATERVSASYLSTNTFHLLGEKPILGRDFLPEDDQPGAPAVVIVGSAIWKARYDADPTLMGRVVRVNCARHRHRTTTSGMGARRWTTGLLIAERALTLALLAGLLRNFLIQTSPTDPATLARIAVLNTRARSVQMPVRSHGIL
jgi:hypothetical protein